MLGIWCLFLCTSLSNFFDSNLKLYSHLLFTVITIGDTKCLSEHSSSFMICFSWISREISLSTLSCRLIGNFSFLLHRFFYVKKFCPYLGALYMPYSRKKKLGTTYRILNNNRLTRAPPRKLCCLP